MLAPQHDLAITNRNNEDHHLSPLTTLLDSGLIAQESEESDTLWKRIRDL